MSAIQEAVVKSRLRIVPQWAIASFEMFHEGTEMTADEFFGPALMPRFFDEGDHAAWEGYLGLLRQGVAPAYAQALSPMFEYVSFNGAEGFGCAEILTLHTYSVAPEYALGLRGRDAADIAVMYLAEFPLEFAAEL